MSAYEGSLTPEEIASTLAQIKEMNHLEMARTYRFAPFGSKFFRLETGQAFMERFEKLGGMTTEVSKEIGV